MWSWIAATALTFLVCFASWALWRAPSSIGFVAIACLASADLLIFPPLWQRNTARQWRTFRLATATILAIAGMVLPVKTTTIKLDMPNPSAAQPH
jgi:hypothetical protein